MSKIKEFFATKIADLCDAISDRLRRTELELEAKEKEEIIQVIEERKERYVSTDKYSGSNLREVIPVLVKADIDLRIAEMEMNVKNAESAIVALKQNLENIDRKRREFLSVLEKIGASPNADEYRLLKDDETNDIILFNPNYEVNNHFRGTALYPAVVAIDCTTNEPRAYATVREMLDSNVKYASLRTEGNMPYKIQDLTKRYSTVGMEIFGVGDIPKAIKMIDDMFEIEAQKIANSIEKKESLIKATLPTERLASIASYYSDKAVYLHELNQVILFGEDANNRLMLNFDYEMGLINAYFKDAEGHTTKVYDLRDTSQGFVILDNEEYSNILKSDVMRDIIDTVGLEIEYKKTVKHEYTDERSYIGDISYQLSDVGVYELLNTEFDYNTQFSEELEQKMLARMKEYSDAVQDDVVVAYNKFNNTLNLISNGGQVSISFDEFGNRMDIYYKKEHEIPNINNMIIDNNRIASNHAKTVMLEDENFKYITKNLAFGINDIARGNAGKVLTEAERAIKRREEKSKGEER